MNDDIGQKRRRRPGGDFPEFGKVTVVSKPAPDAEDRLRRLFTLLAELVQDEKARPADASPRGDPEGEDQGV